MFFYLFGPDGYKLDDAIESEISALAAGSIALAEPTELGRARRMLDSVGRTFLPYHGHLACERPPLVIGLVRGRQDPERRARTRAAHHPSRGRRRRCGRGSRAAAQGTEELQCG